ncbi:MAG: DNA-directed RNA polymerase subunit omega [Rikenellaceae bacterium]|nr:DNA-directed RNA polymerase subunit omega [Rikenellaceae bacterium]MBR2333605.1 DNA-directed RNA polymerase subunit omega [Rikenellaceae bacterium]MBR2452221.1 DNA-directed RNA polymerase subunit omega [Rikenellaceae bacterium]
MDIKKNIPNNTISRKLDALDAPTGNIYESVNIIAKRANQISTEIKKELMRKLDDFSSSTDSLEETFENREQIEISRYYERLPKPAIIATEEFLDDEIYFREGGEAGKKRAQEAREASAPATEA